jgi:hypothetical protein
MQHSKEVKQTFDSTNLDEDIGYKTNFHEIDYQQPLNLKEMEKNYGKGYEYMKQFGYCGKGCRKKGQGIWVPVEPNVKEIKGGLGFHPLGIKQASERPLLNIKIFMIGYDTLTLKHPKFIDSSCKESLEYFDDETLEEIFEFYDIPP